MLVRRNSIRAGSGGAGSASGGDGIERDLEMLEDVTVSLITERRDSQPPGSPAASQVRAARTGSCRAATRTGLGVLI